MNCRNEFICENSKFIHYRLHKMDIICKAVSMGIFGPYFDYFQIDNKGSVLPTNRRNERRESRTYSL